jgi:hypothetical protein
MYDCMFTFMYTSIDRLINIFIYKDLHADDSRKISVGFCINVWICIYTQIVLYVQVHADLYVRIPPCMICACVYVCVHLCIEINQLNCTVAVDAPIKRDETIDLIPWELWLSYDQQRNNAWEFRNERFVIDKYVL